ncbi:glycerophosphodiester phosphodiesterase [Aestuariispira insulae]|uniref:Glycerophosphoryl diester phosphodiesterase n=1 Tax=Aestuariispira insulae TaxID=1461337 RepID=A0A3D9HWL2_9PROT|nr:glycerophosphodiester phosphodiesterase [Aestuariispira insulae]RED53893.1 glycerophosphoryl diester phosphodiesterase [Aestuariispira insulae]
MRLGRFWVGGWLFGAIFLVMGVATPHVGGADGTHVFDLQGHRGARGLVPENSLPGFEKALAIGVDTLEMDLVMTADDVLVVHHDRRLDPDRTRLAGEWLAGEGMLIRDLTLNQLAAYEIGYLRPGSRVRDRFPNQQGLEAVSIPSLQQVISMAEKRSQGRIRYNIEIKHSPLSPTETVNPTKVVRALIQVIRSNALEERAAIQSFDWGVLDLVAEKAPDLSRVYLTAERKWLDNLGRGPDGTNAWLGERVPDWSRSSVPRAIHERGGMVWSPFHGDLTDEALKEAHQLGLLVVVWTVNDPDDMRDLVLRGVDGIITDYPDRLRAVLAAQSRTLPQAFP